MSCFFPCVCVCKSSPKFLNKFLTGNKRIFLPNLGFHVFLDIISNTHTHTHTHTHVLLKLTNEASIEKVYKTCFTSN